MEKFTFLFYRTPSSSLPPFSLSSKHLTHIWIPSVNKPHLRFKGQSQICSNFKNTVRKKKAHPIAGCSLSLSSLHESGKDKDDPKVFSCWAGTNRWTVCLFKIYILLLNPNWKNRFLDTHSLYFNLLRQVLLPQIPAVITSVVNSNNVFLSRGIV